MPFTIRPYRRVPTPCSLAYNQGPSVTLSQAFFLGFCIVITLLVLSSEPVHAEWMLVSGDDATGLAVYVDPGTIRRNGDLAKMWQLLDYRTVQTVAGDSLLSMKRFSEYDCTAERTRLLGYTWFSGNMGSGKLGYSNSDETKWIPVAPQSMNQTLWIFACGKK